MPGFAKSEGFPELNLNNLLENDIILWISNLRKNLGENYEIALDLNFNFKTDGYIRVCKLLEEYNLSWVEIDSFNVSSLSYIRNKINIPITSCENLYGVRQFKPFFDNNSIDFCSIDVIWNGFSDSLKIAELENINEIIETKKVF